MKTRGVPTWQQQEILPGNEDVMQALRFAGGLLPPPNNNHPAASAEGGHAEHHWDRRPWWRRVSPHIC